METTRIAARNIMPYDSLLNVREINNCELYYYIRQLGSIRHSRAVTRGDCKVTSIICVIEERTVSFGF